MHRAHRLPLLEVLPSQLARHCGNVPDDYLGFVLHLEVGLEVHIADVGAEGLDVEDLLRLHLREALPLLGILVREVHQAGDRILAAVAVLQDLLVEVRDLQELRRLHIERLHQAPPELDHGLCREEPLAHAGDLDHGLRDLHGVLEELVGVRPKLLCHEVVQALHVRPDEELVLHDDRQLELPLLVLRDVLREGLHLHVVCGSRGHAPALG
mmetsp:Transcript_79882/g.178739  ORF Transcript_79882/g.178739 Transcript_79882/m.178739 type:complete len:211 (-) Transcript_79882:194-826(-)